MGKSVAIYSGLFDGFLLLDCVVWSMDSDMLESALRDVFDDVVIEFVEYEESDPALDLAAAGEIGEDEIRTEYYSVTLFDSGIAIGELTVAEMPEACVAYLSDLEITPAYRNQGFGSAVVDTLVSVLESDPEVERLFVLPTTVEMKSIVESSGFDEVDWGMEMGDWFVKVL